MLCIGRRLKLLGDRSNDELRWRLAAVAALAGQHLANEAIVSELSATAVQALTRVKEQ